MAFSVAVMVMGDATAGHGVPAALARMRELAAGALEAPIWSLSDGESRQTVADVCAVVAAVQALLLRVVRDLDGRPGAVAGARAGATAATFLVHACRVSPAALDLNAAPTPQTLTETEDGQQVLLGDDRNRSQRYADALTEIARRALSTSSPSGEPAHVLVVATPEQVAAARTDKANKAANTAEKTKPGEAAGWAECAQTGPIGPGTLGRLSCDGVLTRVLLAPDGGVLSLGRSVRVASSAPSAARSRPATAAA